jgi:peptide chain release factor-like protein
LNVPSYNAAEMESNQTDQQLLANCTIETFRGPGPGGQKRNKTSSTVRITHLPTRISALAGESRSQTRNKQVALRRLKLKLALEIRHPWKGGKANLKVSPRSDDFFGQIALVLDALADTNWSISEAAKKLQTTTAQLAKFLHKDSDVLTEVNTHRQRIGLKRLT